MYGKDFDVIASHVNATSTREKTVSQVKNWFNNYRKKHKLDALLTNFLVRQEQAEVTLPEDKALLHETGVATTAEAPATLQKELAATDTKQEGPGVSATEEIVPEPDTQSQ